MIIWYAFIFSVVSLSAKKYNEIILGGMEMENQVLQQIEDYLNGRITKEEYSIIAQEYMTLCGDNLINRNIKSLWN